MQKEDAISLLNYRISRSRTEEGDAIARWKLEKAFPRANILDIFSKAFPHRPTDDIVDEAMRIEQEHAHEPAPPYITHEDLLNNVGYLQRRMLDLGERNLHILVPLSLEYPHARLPEMIWQTHVEATPEEIVAEIYRRESAAQEATKMVRFTT